MRCALVLLKCLLSEAVELFAATVLSRCGAAKLQVQWEQHQPVMVSSSAQALEDLKRRMQSRKPPHVRPTEIAKLIEAGSLLERRALSEQKNSDQPAQYNITLVPVDEEGNPWSDRVET